MESIRRPPALGALMQSMRYAIRLPCGRKLLGFCVIVGLLSSTVQTQTEKDRLAKSTLVFKGTVVRLQASTLAMVPASSSTIVVRVDSVIRTSDATADYTGRE